MSEKKIYCGKKGLPVNRRIGKSFECFDSGLRVGIRVGRQIQENLDQKKIEKIPQDIFENPSKYKKNIKLSSLNKDDLRSIVQKMGGVKFFPAYYNKTKQELIERLIQDGFIL